MCRRAAPPVPERAARGGSSTRPGTGAREKTITGVIIGTIVAPDASGSAPSEVRKAQPPHQQHRAQHAARLPAAAGGDARGCAGRPARRAASSRGEARCPPSAASRESRGNASRRTKIAWSPVAMPVSRERRFIDAGDHLQQRMAAFDLDVEAAPERGLASSARSAVGVRQAARCRHAGTAARRRPPRARRRSSAARGRAARLTSTVAQRPRPARRAVVAAAVDHDHLVAARAQRRERLERSADAGRLVQRRHRR